MEVNEDEEELLRSVALQNARSILLARQRAEQELIRAKEALELRTGELARTLAMMRATLESTTDGILVTDGGGAVTDFNENFVEMWRVPRDVMDSKEHRRLVELTSRRSGDPRQFLARIDAIYAASPPESYDLLELADGRVFERFSRIQFVDGRDAGRVWSFRDITERRRAEHALREQAEWLRVTLSSIGDAVITTDSDGRVTFLNGVAEGLTGWTREEATGRRLEEVFRIINEHTRRPAEDPVGRVLREGGVVGLANHTLLIARDGTETPIDDSAAPIRDDEGRVAGVVLVFRDVAERRRQEAVIEEQRRLAEFGRDIGLAFTESDSLGEMLDHCCELTVRHLDGAFARIWTLDRSGATLELRSSAGMYTHIDGLHARVPVGQFKIGLIALERRPHLTNSVIGDPRVPAQAWAAREGIVAFAGYPLVVEDRLVGVWAAFARHPLSGDTLRAMESVAKKIALGIERKRAEEALREAKREAEEANHAKTQFLAVLSHELRTPLNPILLAVTAMLERPEDPEHLRTTLEMIRQNVNLQARLIDDLLDVMRIVRGKMPLHWEVADGHRLIDQAIQVCRSEVLGKGLEMEVDLAAGEHHVNADPARLQQVFWNLIKNAVKFTPGGGSIAIRTRNEDVVHGREGRFVVEMSDTGIGIEPEVLPTIFDPFQQGETSITRKYGGLGLGLAICRGIVEAHGGTLVAESAGKDRGATFRVVLKALPRSAVERDVEPDAGVRGPEATPPSSLRILVVEDEPATRRLMARLLRGLGHEVTTAGTIAAALEVSEAGGLDLIVSDIGLPDGSGLDLMQRVVSRRGPVPAIALTGYGMEEDIRRSQEAGFTAHLTKPIDFAKLEAMIRQVAH
jgi:PAS domain S-box-containing protein